MCLAYGISFSDPSANSQAQNLDPCSHTKTSLRFTNVKKEDDGRKAVDVEGVY